MPTVLRKAGYRFYFYSNERNEPPHIHIEHAGSYAKFWIMPVPLAFNSGFNSKQILKLRNLVIEYQQYLNETWHEYFN